MVERLAGRQRRRRRRSKAGFAEPFSARSPIMSQLRGGATAPLSPFPLLPLRTGVLFPGTIITLPVGRERSLALLGTLRPGDIFGVATQKSSKVDDPTGADLHPIGTFARVVNITRLPGGGE